MYAKDQPNFTAILFGIAQFIDESEANRAIINKDPMRSLIKKQLTPQLVRSKIVEDDIEKNENLVRNSTYILSKIIDADTDKCEGESDAEIIVDMFNIIDMYSKVPDIVQNAVYVLGVLVQDCMSGEEAEIEFLKDLKDNLSTVVLKLNSENRGGIFRIIKYIANLLPRRGGRRRRTHKKRRAVKKTRRSRK